MEQKKKNVGLSNVVLKSLSDLKSLALNVP